MSAPTENVPAQMQQPEAVAPPVAPPPAPPVAYDPMGFGDQAQQQADSEAQAAGVQTTTKVRNSYWGTDITYKFFLPGEDQNDPDAQYLEYKKMNEGDRCKYQKMISDPVLVHRGSGDARMKVDPARDREALIMCAVSGWNLWKGDRAATFNPTQLDLWRKGSDPDIIDDLEKAIRKANKWLRNQMDLKTAREERDRLKEYVEQLEAEEEEKANSSNK